MFTDGSVKLHKYLMYLLLEPFLEHSSIVHGKVGEASKLTYLNELTNLFNTKLPNFHHFNKNIM